MQSYDEQNILLGTQVLPKTPQEYLERIQAELNRKEVANVVIGKLPTKGQEVTINGLIFEVRFVDYKRGSLQLVIKKYKQDEEDENGITHSQGEIATI